MKAKEKKFLRYKEKKIEYFLREENYFYFCYSSNYNRKKTIEVESNLKKNGFQSYKVFNKSLKTVISNSIFKKFLSFIASPVFIVTPLNKKKIQFFDKNSCLDFKILGLKIHNKFYAPTTIKNSTFFTYRKSVFSFFSFVKKFIKYTAKFEIM